ncbi:hypothetical protein POTOM_042415 [Populus tomentosa]|uniref:ParB-like N-terminal domain-containing protein n=1 Tax=Populus tomentosa TaxID=118781 RepID=A0A8X7YNR8_POPTO|nr:hypothetical protein POTOM_042415 [Populus tomentosa]
MTSIQRNRGEGWAKVGYIKDGKFCFETASNQFQELLYFSFIKWRLFLQYSGAVPGTSTRAQNGGPVILELPLDKIRRPLMRTRANDPNKVKELMDSIKEIGLQVPIDVLEVDGVYYGFSGCHRYEAHQRLGLPTIRCKIRRGTKETLRHHLR